MTDLCRAEPPTRNRTSAAEPDGGVGAGGYAETAPLCSERPGKEVPLPDHIWEPMLPPAAGASRRRFAIGRLYIPALTCPMPNIATSIHSAIATIIRFSVSDTKPSGTLLPPPTQAHFSSRRSR